MKQWMIIGAVAFVLIGAYLWNRNQMKDDMGETVPPVEEIITQQDGTIVKKTGDTVEELSIADIEAKKQEIKENVQNVESVKLQPVAGMGATGTSQAKLSEDTYNQLVTITNMPALEKGYYYEVWLEKADGSKMSIGRVEMTTSTTGQLYYQAKEDRTGTIVVVTKQMEGQKEMGEVVLKQ